jgi:hypothetical protein
MQEALFRSVEIVAPKSIEEIRPLDDKVVALYCFLPECTRCKRFKPRKKAYEKRFHDVVPWDCSRRRQRTIAQSFEVDDLPSYIVLTRDTVEVVCPEV